MTGRVAYNDDDDGDDDDDDDDEDDDDDDDDEDDDDDDDGDDDDNYDNNSVPYIRRRSELYPTISVTSHGPWVRNVATPSVPNCEKNNFKLNPSWTLCHTLGRFQNGQSIDG